MVRIIRLTDKIFIYIENTLIVFSCFAIVSLMAIVSLDAVLRYSINSPLSFSYDIIILYLLPSIMFLSLSMALRSNSHISVDFFAELLPERLWRTLIGVLFLTTALVVGVMAKEGGVSSYVDWANGALMRGVHDWPLWLNKIIVLIGMGALTLRLIHVSLANLLVGLAGVRGIAYPVLAAHGRDLEGADL